MSKLVQLCMFVALGLAALTACDNGEAVSAARISVAKSPSTTAEPTTSTPAPLAEAPKPVPSTKSAAPPPASGALAAKPVSTVEPLRLAGLMAIPPLGAEAAPFFALLAKIARRHDVIGLSMGMSADYREAVMLGATVVRVGTALFEG